MSLLKLDRFVDESAQQDVLYMREYQSLEASLTFVKTNSEGSFFFPKLSPLLMETNSTVAEAHGRLLCESELVNVLYESHEAVRVFLPRKHQRPMRLAQAHVMLNSMNDFWVNPEHYPNHHNLSELIFNFIALGASTEQIIFFLQNGVSVREAKKQVKIPTLFLQAITAPYNGFRPLTL